MLSGDIQASIDGVWRFEARRRESHAGPLRPPDRPGDPAAGIRETARRGSHPQHRAPKVHAEREAGVRRGRCHPDASESTWAARKRRPWCSIRRATWSTRRSVPRRVATRTTPDGPDRRAHRTRRRRRGQHRCRCAGSRHPDRCCSRRPQSRWCRRLRHRRVAVRALRLGGVRRATTQPPRPRPSGCSAPVGDADDMLLVTLGTGIGGGIVANGNSYDANGFAGEFGHMVVSPSGPLCPCGPRLLEAICLGFRSGDARPRRGERPSTAQRGASRGNPQAVRGEHVQAAHATATPTPWP